MFIQYNYMQNSKKKKMYVAALSCDWSCAHGWYLNLNLSLILYFLGPHQNLSSLGFST